MNFLESTTSVVLKLLCSSWWTALFWSVSAESGKQVLLRSFIYLKTCLPWSNLPFSRLIILTITFTHAHLWYIFKYLCVCVHHCMIYIFFNILSCSIKPETCPRTNSCFPICLSRYSGDSRGVTAMYLYAHHLSALPLPGVLLHLRTSCISVCLAWGSQTALFRSLRSHQSAVSLQLGTQATSMPALSVLLTMWSVFLQTPGY